MNPAFRSHAKATAALLAACLFTGCTVGPNYQAPQVPMPRGFDAGPTTQPVAVSAPSTRPAEPPVDLAQWWKSLNDPELDSLLSRAIKANPDLRIAVYRLQEAREAQAIVTGNSLPGAEFSAGAGRGSGTNSTKGRVAGPLNSGTNTTGLKEITQVLGFDAAWEVDLFGQLRRQAEVVEADTQVAAEFRNQVLITLLADVARNYADVRSQQLRLDIARQMIAVSRRTLDFAREKLQRGMVNELDVVLAQRELSTVQSRIAPLEAQLAAAERRVAVLVGQYPEDLRAELDHPMPLPTPPEAVATGLPGELLRRRPDIRQAESQLIAANAQIGVATSNLYPQIFLTAGLGYQGQGLGRQPVDWSSIWSVGPAIRWPLLDFGAVDSLVQQQDFHTRELLVNYRRTIILAIEEVDNSLTNYNAERDRLENLGQAVESARRAVDLANKRYDRGLTDFLNVLDAQRQLFGLQDQYALSEDSTVTQFITVCKALGGGWEGYQPPPPPRAPRPAILAAATDVFTPAHGPLQQGDRGVSK